MRLISAVQFVLEGNKDTEKEFDVKSFLAQKKTAQSIKEKSREKKILSVRHLIGCKQHLFFTSFHIIHKYFRKKNTRNVIGIELWITHFFTI